MPNVTNVVLSLQHGGGTAASTSRIAEVTFSVTFNATEELAGTVFRADINLRSDDNDRTIYLGKRIIKADGGTVSRTILKELTRGQLDEDFDFSGLPPHIIEKIDEWIAVVTISPVVFESATGSSAGVRGSWGLAGSTMDN